MATDLHRLTISATLAGQHGVLAVHAVRGREEVSGPFRYEVDLAADEIMIEELRGTVVRLTLEDHRGLVRHVSGVVARIEALAGEAGETDATRHRLHLVPRPHLLAFRHGFRIFQDLSVPKVVEQVLRDAGLDPKTWRMSLAGSYPERPYCVQYDETEWDFLCRLLEEEGIWFAFDQTEDGHVLVIADASADAPKASPDALPHEAGGGIHFEDLRAWGATEARRVGVGRVLLDDYDFLRPSLDIHAEVQAADGHGTWFEYPGRYAAPTDGKRLARTRLAELRAGRRALRFTTNAIELQPGRRVEITDHPTATGSWFVTAVTLHARPEEVSAGTLSEAGPAGAWLEVEAVPADLPFRPARHTPRPRAAGPQTARVTGPAGEEIHCDEHGRVKLQFHWDRDGALDEKSSCWIRVVQPHTTGSVLIPRVGWEVLVEFLEGDPDRPICLGRLYNPLFPPPYDLPAQKTVTAHRSNSSPGAGGANELRFEDAAGTQAVFLNAQRDLVMASADKRTRRTGKNEKRTVGANRKDSVGAEETVSVTGNQSASVGASHQISAASRTVEVGGDLAEEVKKDSKLQVGAAEMIQVGNPVDALLQLAATEALQAVTAAAQGFADSAAKAVVAPLKPALDAVAQRAGSLPRLSGPAAALLGGDPGKGMGPLPPDAEKALQNAGPDLEKAVSSAITGAAAAAAPDAVKEIAEAIGTSDGNIGITVGGNFTEIVGAVQILTGIGGIAIGVGGSSTETVGAARIEIVGGGRAEKTGGSKSETVGGAYLVNVKKGIAVDAGGAMAILVGGAVTQKIGKGHALTAKGPAVVNASRIKLKASDKITLKCGKSEIVLSGDGVSIKGLDVTLEASSIKITPPAIGPG